MYPPPLEVGFHIYGVTQATAASAKEKATYHWRLTSRGGWWDQGMRRTPLAWFEDAVEEENGEL